MGRCRSPGFVVVGLAVPGSETGACRQNLRSSRGSTGLRAEGMSRLISSRLTGWRPGDNTPCSSQGVLSYEPSCSGSDLPRKHVLGVEKSLVVPGSPEHPAQRG